MTQKFRYSKWLQDYCREGNRFPEVVVDCVTRPLATSPRADECANLDQWLALKKGPQPLTPQGREMLEALWEAKYPTEPVKDPEVKSSTSHEASETPDTTVSQEQAQEVFETAGEERRLAGKPKRRQKKTPSS